MNCNRCNRELAEKERYVYAGKVFCEDCLMTIGLSTKECDPWATYVETSDRKRHGDTGADGLNETQARIYKYVKSKDRATRQEVMKSLGLSEPDFNAQLMPLMHSELVKERSEGGEEYLIPIG
jgi:predicted HTH transcriptional regulator